MFQRIIVSLLCLGCAGVSFSSIRVIENTPKKFTFQWTTENLRASQNAGMPSSISFSGANVDLGDNGEPLVPAVSFYVGVPLKGAVSVRVTQVSSHVEPLRSPLRVRNAPKTGPRYPGLRFSETWISDPLYAQFGSLRAAQLILRPVLYTKQGSTAQVLDKAEITVEFPAAQTAPGAVTGKSDYARMLQKLILNYQVAAGWAAAAPLAKHAAVKEYPLKTTQTMLSFAVGDGHSGFNEGTIDENGMIRIRGSDIVRLLGSSPPINRVALYVSYKGELPVSTPPPDQIPDGVSEVPIIRVDVNNNDTLDANDYLLAYVSSISDWQLDTVSRPHRYNYKLDHYDDYRHYWIAVKDAPGLVLAKTAPVSALVQDTVTSFLGHLLLKKSVWPSLTQGAAGGLEWAWTSLTYYMPSYSIDNLVLPHADPAAACSVRVVTGYTGASPSLLMSFHDSSICTECQYGGWFPLTYNTGNNLVLSISARKSDTIEIKQVEFKYGEKLDMSGLSSLTVFSPEDSGIVRYRLSGLPSDLVYITRIANGDASMSLIDTVRGGGTYEWTDTAGIGVRYYVCTQQAIANAPALTQVLAATAASGSDVTFSIRDLRTLTTKIDYLIVTHPNFFVQAQMLARHKMHVGPFINPKAIYITDIYNQFSGGNTDPAAVRNCLEYVRAHVNAAFEYVVLMGLGHYDYRNIATRDTSFIPAPEFNDKCIEDFFVYLDPGDAPDLTSATPNCFLGRIPCRTAQEAYQAVQKIIQMEDPAYADFGAWRNRMLLVADDDMQGILADPLGLQHMESSELIDSIIEHLCPAVDMRKDYEFEYPWNAQHEKPEAKQALIDGINNGVAYVNYFGHGASNVLADEHIFLAEDIGSLQNSNQYPLFSAFSCSVGEFDLPGTKRSLAEYFVLAQKSGAITTVSATREAYASDNEKLAKNFFSFCFDTTDSAAWTMGQALAYAKAVGRDDNQKVYSYLGDPAMDLLRPSRRISFSIVDNAGKVLKDTLKALQQVTIKGSILTKNGTTDVQFGSHGSTKIQLSLFNPAYVTSRKDGGASPASYKMPGTPIFAGQTSVVNGVFEQHILLPKNVSFNTPGIRLTGYSWGDSVALGSNSGYVFHGFSATKITDSIGPSISVRPVYQGGSTTAAAPSSTGASFTDKITAPLPLTIEIMLFDSSGIDAVSTGPDEGITFEVPGIIARTNIDHKFLFGQGDYRRGTANWTFDAGTMTPGSYTMNITAQDLLGNLGKRSVAFDVIAQEDLALYHVFTYPNPVAMGQASYFYYDLSKTQTLGDQDRVIVTIRLFTLSGRLVRVFKDAKRGEVFDGRDNFGNRLSPGVYLYQVIAEDRINQKVVKSGIEKLAINPPR